MSKLEEARIALTALFPASAEPAAPEGEEEVAVTESGPGVVAMDPVKTGAHLNILCSPDQVVQIAEIMNTQGFFLEAISGVDWLKQEQLEVLYDYNRQDEEHCRILIRVRVPRDAATLPTISHILPAADWHERETFDFYGVHFADHPNLIRILLPEDADFHPLLKDYMP